jgi:hypothetical protein
VKAPAWFVIAGLLASCGGGGSSLQRAALRGARYNFERALAKASQEDKDATVVDLVRGPASDEQVWRIRHLLDNGASATPALRFAIGGSPPSIVTLLLEHGAKVTANDVERARARGDGVISDAVEARGWALVARYQRKRGLAPVVPPPQPAVAPTSPREPELVRDELVRQMDSADRRVIDSRCIDRDLATGFRVPPIALDPTLRYVIHVIAAAPAGTYTANVSLDDGLLWSGKLSSTADPQRFESKAVVVPLAARYRLDVTTSDGGDRACIVVVSSRPPS